MNINNMTTKEINSLLKIKNKTLYLFYQPKDNLNIKAYYLEDKNSFFHHDSLPSLIVIDKSGFRRDCYFTNGLLHRKDGPSEIVYYPKKDVYDGHISYTIISSFHEKKILLKDKFLMGIKDIHKSSQLLDLYQSAFRNSPSSSSTGPSYISLSPTVKVHIYEKDGSMHREDGPAFIEWNKKGEIVSSEWHIEGECIDPREDY